MLEWYTISDVWHSRHTESNLHISENKNEFCRITQPVTLTIGAGAGGAVVNLLLTVEPCIPCGALTEVASIRVVSTAAAIGAGPISTRHGAQLAVVAIETVRASAGICVFQILWGKNRTGLTSRSVLQLQLLQTAPIWISIFCVLYLLDCF